VRLARDTPSFLNLLRNGLNDPEHPEWGSWGGRFRRENPARNLWVEATDSVAGYETDPDPRMAALYRWRPDWQADFAARLDWCVKPFAEANHPPQLKDLRKRQLKIRAGRLVKLSASQASDPDHDDLRYNWYFYPEEGSYQGALPTLKTMKKTASFTAPNVSSPETLHVILEVTDNGDPALTIYQRFIVSVEPD
jgi:hypothetical protein